MSGDGRASPTHRQRAAYAGSRRKLVLAFDVGTTFSGVSYCILDPGMVPKIRGVTEFPAQLANSGGCKIPTIIYYDQEGEARAIGAEALQDGVFENAEEGNWAKAEWFKLHLRSRSGKSQNRFESVPSLPTGKTVVDVFADFLSYLLKCTATHIGDTHPYGKELWQDFLSATLHSGTKGRVPSNDGIHFVLSHPNGWGGKEQALMRKAAAKAQLIRDDSEGHSRITFVTEGEASLHFAVQKDLLSHISEKEGIVVVDAGGGTIDVSTYKRHEGRGTDAFKEISVPMCYFHGSVFVKIAAKDFLREVLCDSPFLDDLEHIASCFDTTTKHRFRDDQEPQYVRFGGRKDNDPDVNIRFGQMKLEGDSVAKFFGPSIECIVKAVMEQKKKFPNVIRHVVLVGGFSASGWLFHRVQDVLTQQGLTVIRPENNVVKAVSDGAVSFYLDHFVRTRMARITYGTPVALPYNAEDPEHYRRRDKLRCHDDGVLCVPGHFQVVLAKGTQVDEDTEFSSGPIESTARRARDLKQTDVSIMCYHGEAAPGWLDMESENFSTCFKVFAQIPPRIVNASDRTYSRVDFDVVMLFGLTELKAFIRWTEHGIVKKSPAKLIYD